MEQTRNKKLRLVVTEKCHNKCPLCCNNRFDLSQLPVVDRWDYEEIMITGGEPLLFADRVVDLASSITALQNAMGINPSRLYLYTSLPAEIDGWSNLSWVAYWFNGICITPHTKRDVETFIDTISSTTFARLLANRCSMRLNLFADVRKLIEDSDIDLSDWKIKHMEWIKDCPVPEGEDLRRINNLFV